MLSQFVLMVFSGLNYPCTELLSILLWFKEEGVANNIDGTEYWYVVILGLPISIIMM